MFCTKDVTKVTKMWETYPATNVPRSSSLAVHRYRIVNSGSTNRTSRIVRYRVPAVHGVQKTVENVRKYPYPYPGTRSELESFSRRTGRVGWLVTRVPGYPGTGYPGYPRYRKKAYPVPGTL
eukprot:2113011-Rhodomonas_salina.4